ncbi:hypothetical protein TCON_1671 [Astathelohania contejeani]|uniref:PIN domain-containing protein n=1 Tax=Astathelohania contejeani TaxID=164912 RepID=A0ABQ7HYA0_9MICR|nr:hypothetical protein TCON_1671 [Thelohania contejeani]
MSIINIIPDTNVLIKNLNLLKACLNHKSNVLIRICINKVILNELDSHKTSIQGARDAVRFVMKHIAGTRVVVEGYENPNFMELEYAGSRCLTGKDVKDLQTGTNDDQILGYAIHQENPILLTNDKLLALKAKLYHLKYLLIEDIKEDEIIDKIYTIMNNKYLQTITNESTKIDKYIRQVLDVIIPIVEYLLRDKLGDVYKYYIPDNREEISLDNILLIVVKHFHIFDDYIPRLSLKFIKDILKRIKENKISKNDLETLLVIFRRGDVELV